MCLTHVFCVKQLFPDLFYFISRLSYLAVVILVWVLALGEPDNGLLLVEADAEVCPSLAAVRPLDVRVGQVAGGMTVIVTVISIVVDVHLAPAGH